MKQAPDKVKAQLVPGPAPDRPYQPQFSPLFWTVSQAFNGWK